MAENPASDPQNPREEYPDSASSAPDLRFEAFHGGNGDEERKGERPALRALSSVGSNAARYKSMSPARLPISRSPCLTIPPGLSPTTLLDSPVLLPNPKAEPSPTTGIFSRPPTTHDGVNSDFFSSRRDTPNDNRRDEGNSSKFEFKPHTNSSSNSNLSSLGHLANSSANYQQLKHLAEIQGQYQSQKFAFSTSITENVKLSSDDFTRSMPALVPQVHMVTSRASASSEAAPNELRQRQGSDGSIQPMHSDNIDHNGYNPPVAVDKSLEDGYGWRKYGQKHVKGSEFPRSYYKCTHPNCQVKKQLERSHDGHITEVIYKGSHDHPKPLPGRRSVLCANLSSQTEERCDGFSSLISTDVKLINGHGQQSHQIEENGGSELSPASVNEDDIGACVQPNKIGDVDDDDDEADDPDSKRRKRETGGIDITPTINAAREPRVVVQTLSEVDILDDGYRWRKYGQKVVKGNPNPRSYYKCTNAGCPVRKHVERASHDPKAVITTYEGKHNHDVPSARTSSHAVAGPKIPNDASSVTCNRPSALNMFKTDDTMKGMLHCFDRQDQPDIVSLDLGVGINLSSENRSNGNQQTSDTEQAHAQIEMTGCGSGKMIQAAPVSTYYGSSLKEGVDCYGPRNASLDSFSFKTQPINHPTDTYRQNMGRLVMGP